jgi:DNA-binding transcriptional LysR family regulator
MSQTFLELLKDFRDTHNGVDVEVVSDVSRHLLELTQNGVLDVTFFKKFPGQGAGHPVCRQQLAWVAAPNMRIPAADEPIPLILFPEGSFLRSAIFSTLEAAGRRWRVAYSCASLEHLILAIHHEMGVGVLSRERLISDDRPFTEIDLPPLEDIEIAVIHGRGSGPTARALAEKVSRYCCDNAATIRETVLSQ